MKKHGRGCCCVGILVASHQQLLGHKIEQRGARERQDDGEGCVGRILQQEAARRRAGDEQGPVQAHDPKRDGTARAALHELRGQCHVERSEFKSQPDGEQRADARVDRKSGAHDHAVNASVERCRRGHADGQSVLFLMFEPARDSLERHHERGADGKSGQRRRRLIVGAKVRK